RAETLRVDTLVPIAEGDRVGQAVSGSRRVAVVLLNFTNDRSQPLSAADVNDMMFGTGSFGSVGQFYRDQSFGLLSFSGTVYDWCQSACSRNCDWGSLSYCGNLCMTSHYG